MHSQGMKQKLNKHGNPYSSTKRSTRHNPWSRKNITSVYPQVSAITDHKPLVVIVKKDVTSLSHRHQRILLQIHQYNIRILYKPGPQLFITGWISRHKPKTETKEPRHMH